MARPLRITFAGAWYHVMNRGAAKKIIFHSDMERRIFLQLLERMSRRYKIEIHSFCLMDNHYHLLVRTPLPNISRAIQYLDGIYAQKFNLIHNIDGPLFKGRFKTKLVSDDIYLTHLSRYIHLNPIDAMLCKHPFEYEWSSCKNYLGLTRKYPWLYLDEILERFQTDRNNKYFNYAKFLFEGNDANIEEFFSKNIPTIGNNEFIKNIKKNFIAKIPHTEIPEEQVMHNLFLPSIEQITSSACKYFNITQDHLHRRAGHIARDIIIYIAIENCNKTLGEVASIFTNIGKSRISTIYKNMLNDIQNDAQLMTEIEEIVSACGK